MAPRLLRALLALVLVLAGALAVSGATTDARAASSSVKREVVFYQLGYEPGIERPREVFLTVNNGPRFVQLTWRRWGTKHAVAKGTYRERYRGKGSPVTVHFDGFRSCPETGATIYRRAYGMVTKDDGSKRRVQAYSGCAAPSM